MSDYGWWVVGIDGNHPDLPVVAMATTSEAEAVACFWSLANSHSVGHLSFYTAGRILWLDNNTRLVEMGIVDYRLTRSKLTPPPIEAPSSAASDPPLARGESVPSTEAPVEARAS
ncbi:MAG TPA: hypothetical protein VNA57_02085 [Acidimicrobiales bacterium]|nr:hypothetical protein [Acidimicrobiales bacterium]